MKAVRGLGWMFGILLVAGSASDLRAQGTAGSNVVMTLPAKYPDQLTRNNMPALPGKNPIRFAPTGIRFGTRKQDVAFFLFDQKKKGGTGPDVVYLWIADHPEFNEPKPFRGKPARDPEFVLFPDIGFTADGDGVKRTIRATLKRHVHPEGPIELDLTVQTEFDGKKTVMKMGMPMTASLFGNMKGVVRTFSLFDPPILQVRATGDGTDVSMSLTFGEWCVLPLEGMDKAIQLDLTDSSGKSVQKHTLVNTPEKYMEGYSWKVKLRPLMKDMRYRMHASLFLGPWIGDLRQEAMTMTIDRKI